MHGSELDLANKSREWDWTTKYTEINIIRDMHVYTEKI